MGGLFFELLFFEAPFLGENPFFKLSLFLNPLFFKSLFLNSLF
ncbi:hypothetical protein HPHPP13B_1451 [Helicobacter pylori Hp P-13b]|uniref:Uncharacterized protein n=1 Tax=Helicobacter pylori Hp P-13b TaxID=992107 RepID=A0ABC9QPP4_HELPX|nr:hypothetical protein HPHPP13B_1451 [Helicobacter pylori Hp P-13b]